jgi:uncharacterized protein involved in exopolysaccharide biosynthesis
MTVLGVILATAFSFLSPIQYSSSVRLLITQANAVGTDPYTTLKFTERIASSLSELLYSSSFANNIIGEAKGLDPKAFPNDEYQRRKQWQKTIETAVTPGTGIMVITAYQGTREQATSLIDAASRELALQAPNYFGSNVRVQVIDAPLPSQWIARPTFLKNGLFGAVLGFMLGLIWVVATQGRR